MVATKDLPNYGKVTSSFSRSGQPTTKGFQLLFDRGVDVVVKLNENWEYNDAKEKAEFKGRVRPLHLSAFSHPDQVEEAKVIAKTINEILSLAKKVHVHCHLGRDRTGLVVGLWRLLYNGDSFKQVKAEWDKYGEPFHSYQAMLQAEAKKLKTGGVI
jgi:protein tyrosine/serine phosphatase